MHVHLCLTRWADQRSHRGPGNQLSFSWGRGLATREQQHARQPHGQAVIVWFTHNQHLIVSHWSAGTCNLEENVNSLGFWRAELLCLSGNEGEAGALMWLAPGCSELLTACSHAGLGTRLCVRQFDRQLTWLAPQMPVNPYLKAGSAQESFTQEKASKTFLSILLPSSGWSAPCCNSNLWTL